MKHFFTVFSFLLTFFILTYNLVAQSIQVNSTYTKEQLVKDIFLGSSCLDIDESSIKITGWNFDDGGKSYGYFDKGSSSFSLSKGILLSTGKLSEAPGPNNDIKSSDDNRWEGDSDLERALNISRSTNATILEFDFTSHQTDKISFDYLFASEQYLKRNDPGNCGYTDGFAFLIKELGSNNSYKNLAVIPGTTTPVSVITVYGYDGKCSVANPQYFDQFNPVNAPISFNGQTKIMTASTSIKVGVKYHLKIVIADQGNGLYDSGVFLKAGSFIGEKSLGNNILLCPNSSETIDAQITNATYQWYKDGEILHNETNQTLTVRQEGHYVVDIIENNGCQTKGYIDVEELPEITIYNDDFSFCLDNPSIDLNINLNNQLEQIIEDFNPNFMEAKFYSTENDANTNSTNTISSIKLNSITKSQTLYVWVKSNTCSPKIFPVHFYIKDPSVYDEKEFELCDTDLDGKENINLRDYLDQISIQPIESAYFFENENDAKNNINSISAQQILTSDKIFYARFNQVGYCETVVPLKFKFKQPKKSDILKDVTICSTSTTTLDAGDGFESYLWSTGATTSSINNVTVGKYTVLLGYNGCQYLQEVNVIAAENPVIESIDIQGLTVTVSVKGSTPPYYYSLDNGPFQLLPQFSNVTLGKHIISVKSSLNCEIVTKEFSLIKLVNFISPNGDGKNDVLNFSQLKNKIFPKFLIYDRFGKLVFEGNDSNQFIWNGKQNGFVVTSTSYWYTIEWKESENSEIQKFTNWIMVKNYD